MFLQSDLFEIDQKNWISITIRLSGLIIGEETRNKSPDETVRVLTKIANKIGIPHTIKTDNGMNYTSGGLTKFFEKMGIKHITGSPYYHEEKGQVEKSVNTLKRTILRDRLKHTVSHLSYAPICRNKVGQEASLVEIFFGRSLKSDIPK